jgi:hypothetical protein
MKRVTIPFHIPTILLLSDPLSIKLFAEAQARRNERKGGILNFLRVLIQRIQNGN